MSEQEITQPKPKVWQRPQRYFRASLTRDQKKKWKLENKACKTKGDGEPPLGGNASFLQDELEQ